MRGALDLGAMRTPLGLALPLLALALGGCSSSSSPAAPADAGEDATADAGYDSGGFHLPGDDSGSSGGPDSGAKCSDLQSVAQQKATAASACNPQGSKECNGTTPGICCPLTITDGTNTSAVDDFNAAVNAFKNAGCTIDCTRFPCPPAPSNTCTGSGNAGLCK
jgi:hypothetical protein